MLSKAILIMPRFSTYTADYSRLETVPWYFWTDEERSYVIKQGYERLYLSSEEVKPYLDVTKRHYITQWLVPAALAVTYQFGLKNLSFFNTFYRKSQAQGRLGTIIFNKSRSSILRSLYMALVKLQSILYSKITKPIRNS